MAQIRSIDVSMRYIIRDICNCTGHVLSINTGFVLQASQMLFFPRVRNSYVKRSACTCFPIAYSYNVATPE